MSADKKSRRERATTRRKKQQSKSRVQNIIIAVVILGVLGWAISELNKPPVGMDMDIMESANHIPVGTKVEYNTSPPSSGEHYDQSLPAGFYSPDDAIMGQPYPHQFAVHSMEHGYVIIWYNCEAYPGDCAELIGSIHGVVDPDPAEIVVFPWSDMDTPLALTSWGAIQPLESFDPVQIEEFISSNRNNPRAPEWNVP